MGKKPHPPNHQINDAKKLITISSLAGRNTLQDAFIKDNNMARRVNDFLPDDLKERLYPSIWVSLDPDDPEDDDLTDDFEDDDDDEEEDEDSDFEEEEDD